MRRGVTVHGLEAAHSNVSGRYLKFCFAKIAPNLYHFLITAEWHRGIPEGGCSHGTRSKCAFLTREQ